MNVQMQTAPRLASESGGISKAVTAQNYRIHPAPATEFAAAAIAARFRVSLTLARVVCELAQIGGRLA
ncbi:hypothetical protein GGR00_004778 [Aminobacter aganoensis]|uniref:Uncharacterized protein n=1 Tax=Aminobacter aganoensis TaxID=83264 RepID=A0A7X0FC70_9HYPH|nr:hypothetical protein [Aminobacter aganoensis]